MTNGGVNGYPTTGPVPDGSITAGKLAAPLGWGRLVSGNYYLTAGPTSTTVLAGLGVGTLRLVPWMVPNSCTISRIGGAVTTTGDSGSVVRLGIYADTGSGYPGRLVLDAGTIAGDSATVQEITVSQALTAGLYWVGGAVQVVTTTQPTLNVVSNTAPPFNALMGTSAPGAASTVTGYSQTGATGALPAVFATAVSPAGSAPRVFVKAA